MDCCVNILSRWLNVRNVQTFTQSKSSQVDNNCGFVGGCFAPQYYIKTTEQEEGALLFTWDLRSIFMCITCVNLLCALKKQVILQLKDNSGCS